MPDSPAPTTKASRCSLSPAFSGHAGRVLPLLRLAAPSLAPSGVSRSVIAPRSRGGAADELVVQRALLTEELGAPALDELGRVAVVGVEVRPLVLLELVPDLLADDRGLAELVEALEERARVVRGAVEQ